MAALAPGPSSRPSDMTPTESAPLTGEGVLKMPWGFLLHQMSGSRENALHAKECLLWVEAVYRARVQSATSAAAWPPPAVGPGPATGGLPLTPAVPPAQGQQPAPADQAPPHSLQPGPGCHGPLAKAAVSPACTVVSHVQPEVTPPPGAPKPALVPGQPPVEQHCQSKLAYTLGGSTGECPGDAPPGQPSCSQPAAAAPDEPEAAQALAAAPGHAACMPGSARSQHGPRRSGSQEACSPAAADGVAADGSMHSGDTTGARQHTTGAAKADSPRPAAQLAGPAGCNGSLHPMHPSVPRGTVNISPAAVGSTHGACNAAAISNPHLATNERAAVLAVAPSLVEAAQPAAQHALPTSPSPAAGAAMLAGAEGQPGLPASVRCSGDGAGAAASPPTCGAGPGLAGHDPAGLGPPAGLADERQGVDMEVAVSTRRAHSSGNLEEQTGLPGGGSQRAAAAAGTLAAAPTGSSSQGTCQAAQAGAMGATKMLGLTVSVGQAAAAGGRGVDGDDSPGSARAALGSSELLETDFTIPSGITAAELLALLQLHGKQPPLPPPPEQQQQQQSPAPALQPVLLSAGEPAEQTAQPAACAEAHKVAATPEPARQRHSECMIPPPSHVAAVSPRQGMAEEAGDSCRAGSTAASAAAAGAAAAGASAAGAAAAGAAAASAAASTAAASTAAASAAAASTAAAGPAAAGQQAASTQPAPAPQPVPLPETEFNFPETDIRVPFADYHLLIASPFKLCPMTEPSQLATLPRSRQPAPQQLGAAGLHPASRHAVDAAAAPGGAAWAQAAAHPPCTPLCPTKQPAGAQPLVPTVDFVPETPQSGHMLPSQPASQPESGVPEVLPPAAVVGDFPATAPNSDKQAGLPGVTGRQCSASSSMFVQVGAPLLSIIPLQLQQRLLPASPAGTLQAAASLPAGSSAPAQQPQAAAAPQAGEVALFWTLGLQPGTPPPGTGSSHTVLEAMLWQLHHRSHCDSGVLASSARAGLQDLGLLHTTLLQLQPCVAGIQGGCLKVALTAGGHACTAGSKMPSEATAAPCSPDGAVWVDARDAVCSVPSSPAEVLLCCSGLVAPAAALLRPRCEQQDQPPHAAKPAAAGQGGSCVRVLSGRHGSDWRPLHVLATAGRPLCVAAHAELRLLAAGTERGHVQVWSFDAGWAGCTSSHCLPSGGFSSPIVQLALSPCGSHALAVHRTGRLAHVPLPAQLLSMQQPGAGPGSGGVTALPGIGLPEPRPAAVDAADAAAGATEAGGQLGSQAAMACPPVDADVVCGIWPVSAAFCASTEAAADVGGAAVGPGLAKAVLPHLHGPQPANPAGEQQSQLVSSCHLQACAPPEQQALAAQSQQEELGVVHLLYCTAHGSHAGGAGCAATSAACQEEDGVLCAGRQSNGCRVTDHSITAAQLTIPWSSPDCHAPPVKGALGNAARVSREAGQPGQMSQQAAVVAVCGSMCVAASRTRRCVKVWNAHTGAVVATTGGNGSCTVGATSVAVVTDDVVAAAFADGSMQLLHAAS